jgi:vacuolar-type H+-ATPase subunit I/STV1
MKMKMSILLGVVHMNLGIMMSLFNNLYFKDRLSTICEFVPQVSHAAGLPSTQSTQTKQLWPSVWHWWRVLF